MNKKSCIFVFPNKAFRITEKKSKFHNKKDTMRRGSQPWTQKQAITISYIMSRPALEMSGKVCTGNATTIRRTAVRETSVSQHHETPRNPHEYHSTMVSRGLRGNIIPIDAGNSVVFKFFFHFGCSSQERFYTWFTTCLNSSLQFYNTHTRHHITMIKSQLSLSK